MVIHSYGSSGKGGTLCVGLRKSFGLRKKEGVIKDAIAGEDFSIFNDTVLALLEAVPELRGDPDLGAARYEVHLKGAAEPVSVICQANPEQQWWFRI
jgi:hypothetical protein